MKLSKKTVPTLLGLLLLGFVTGSLVWEIVERILAAAGVVLDLSVGPVGFDVHAVALSVRANPGSLVGLLGAGVLFGAL